MSLKRVAIPPIPEETQRVAQAIFPANAPLLRLHDALGPLYDDPLFADLFPSHGQPAETPWRLALVTVFQFMEGLSDRQAAHAVRTRIDWKYALRLELTDPGFDYSVLSEFRTRLLAGQAEQRLLTTLLETAKAHGWVQAKGRQRTDSTHVLAAVRTLNRLELVGETLRHALNVLAEVAPEWLRGWVPAEWYDRYSQRIEGYRLPPTQQARDAYAQLVGADGATLLWQVDQARPTSCPGCTSCPPCRSCAQCGSNNTVTSGEQPRGAGCGGAPPQSFQRPASAWNRPMIPRRALPPNARRCGVATKST